MSDDEPPRGLRLVADDGERDAVDPRVLAVLQALGGQPLGDVARSWAVDPALVSRWLGSFVAAGTAAVTNRPLEDAARQRDRFLTAFAHELRTPLAVAQGWVQLLTDEEDLPPAVVGTTVRRLDEALTRLRERVLDVELLAQASLGVLRLEPVSTTVDVVAGDLPAPLEGDGGLRVRVDPALFRRVLRDLWEAGTLAPTPRSQRLETRLFGPWVEVRVVRDADPIEPRVLQALFEPFDLNDDATGVTIGLYLARALVVAHGGTLGVDQDDESAVLWVRVPQEA